MNPDSVHDRAAPPHASDRQVSRRVAVGAMVAAAPLAVAACSGNGGSAPSGGAFSDATRSVPTSAGGGGSGGGAAGQGTQLVAVDQVPVGGSASATLSGSPVLVVRPDSTSVVCFSAVCPHQHCTIPPSTTNVLECPCHHSRFNTFTGAVIQGPASQPLLPIPVDVVNGEVVAHDS